MILATTPRRAKPHFFITVFEFLVFDVRFVVLKSTHAQPVSFLRLRAFDRFVMFGGGFARARARDDRFRKGRAAHFLRALLRMPRREKAKG